MEVKVSHVLNFLKILPIYLTTDYLRKYSKL